MIWVQFAVRRNVIISQFYHLLFICRISQPSTYNWLLFFHSAEASPPERNFSFVSSCDLIPTSEDSYDYDPDICVHRLHTLLAHANMKELIILTEEKAKSIHILNIKVSIWLPSRTEENFWCLTLYFNF